jgi:proton-dependent oligopeptide transporter, POT family
MWNIVTLVGLLITGATIPPVLFQLRKHPRGLFVLFFAEMWERFSYYGMRGILVAYLTQHFLYERPLAQSQYGAYTSLVYLLPLVGGYLADKYLGTRKAIAFGALLLVLGHSLMAVEQKPAIQTLTYEGRSYDFAAAGRIEERKVQLTVDGANYSYDITPGVGLTIRDLPAGASLPALLPEKSFTIGVRERQSEFVAFMYLALALIATGVGFLKANISTIVGQLYPERDPRRDSGFTLYYYGINFGAFWASILCAYLGVKVGWWAGFGLAGVGMAAGYVAFVLGRPWLEGKGEPPSPEKLKQRVGPVSLETAIYIGGGAMVALVYAMFQANAAVRVMLDGMIAATQASWAAAQQAAGVVNPDASKAPLGLGLTLADFFVVIGFVLLIGSIAVLSYLGNFMARKCTPRERNRMILALTLISASVVFWTLFEQAGTSLNLFAQDTTNLTLLTAPIQLGPLFIGTPEQLTAAGLSQSQVWFLDATFGAAQTQSFNSGFILLLAPAFAAMWAYLETRRRDPNDPLKFGVALLQVGAGFLVLVWGANFAGPAVQVPLIFLVIAYLLHTTGELCLSPVGLSMVTKLSPAAVGSTMMAVWFLSSAWAQWIGAVVAALTATETIGGVVTDKRMALDAYVSVFAWIGWIAIGIGAVLSAFSNRLQKLAGEGGVAAPDETPVEVGRLP